MRDRPSSNVCAGVALGVALASVAAPAPVHARSRTEVQVAFDARVTALPAMPRLELDPVYTSVRSLPAARLASSGGQLFAGGAVDVGLVLRDRIDVPILGAAVLGPLLDVLDVVDVLVVALVVLVVVAALVLGEAQVDHRLAQRASH